MSINPTPPVNCRYGAPMGRPSGTYLETIERIHLVRVPLDAGGYDKGGAYWGCGEPIYYAEDCDGNSQFLRATSRDAAKEKIRADFPEARFFR